MSAPPSSIDPCSASSQKSFGGHYGDDLVQQFADLVADRRARAAWARTGVDLIVTVPRYRLESIMKRTAQCHHPERRYRPSRGGRRAERAHRPSRTGALRRRPGVGRRATQHPRPGHPHSRFQPSSPSARYLRGPRLVCVASFVVYGGPTSWALPTRLCRPRPARTPGGPAWRATRPVDSAQGSCAPRHLPGAA